MKSPRRCTTNSTYLGVARLFFSTCLLKTHSCWHKGSLYVYTLFLVWFSALACMSLDQHIFRCHSEVCGALTLFRGRTRAPFGKDTRRSTTTRTSTSGPQRQTDSSTIVLAVCSSLLISQPPWWWLLDDTIHGCGDHLPKKDLVHRFVVLS